VVSAAKVTMHSCLLVYWASQPAQYIIITAEYQYETQ
jgi:hypothetical protein